MAGVIGKVDTLAVVRLTIDPANGSSAQELCEVGQNRGCDVLHLTCQVQLPAVEQQGAMLIQKNRRLMAYSGIGE